MGMVCAVSVDCHHVLDWNFEKDRTDDLEKVEKIPFEQRYVDEGGVSQDRIRERGRALRGDKVEGVRRGGSFLE